MPLCVSVEFLCLSVYQSVCLSKSLYMPVCLHVSLSLTLAQHMWCRPSRLGIPSSIQNQKKEICESPKPSKSGVHFTKPFTSDNDGNHLSHELSDSDEDGDVSDACCVCMKKSPPNLQSLPYLKIVNWAACDKCDHWVHLTFCSKVHVVRRHSDFLCPHCVE